MDGQPIRGAGERAAVGLSVVPPMSRKLDELIARLQYDPTDEDDLVDLQKSCPHLDSEPSASIVSVGAFLLEGWRNCRDCGALFRQDS